MLLVICRHAKSDWGDSSLVDFERPLNKRGMRSSVDMGKFLKEKGIAFDVLLSSSALRAKTTAQRVAKEIGFPQDDIVYENNMYLADIETIIHAIEDYGKGKSNMMIFGHNPGFTELVNFFGVRLDNLPTNGMVAFEFDCEDCAELHHHKAKYLWHQFPKEL